MHAHERKPPSISGCPHIAAQPIGIKVDDVADLVKRLGIEKYNYLEVEDLLKFVVFREIHAHHHPHVRGGLIHVEDGEVWAFDENVHLNVLHKKEEVDQALSSFIGKLENVTHPINLDEVCWMVREHKQTKASEQSSAPKAKRQKK